MKERSHMSQTKEKDERIPRAIYGVSASLSFTSQITRRFYPLFAASIDTPVSLMGFLRSMENLSSSVLQLLWGNLADKFGKRLFLFLGLLGGGLCTALLIRVNSPYQLVPLILIWSLLFSMIGPSWTGLLGDYTIKESRGEVLGKIGTVGELSGLASMMIIAILTYGAWSSYSLPFLLSASLSFVGAILVLLIKEKGDRVGFNLKDLFSAIRDRSFRRFLILSLMFWFSMGFAWPLFPYITVKVVNATLWQIALINAGMRAMTSATQGLFGKLLDRFGRKPFMVIGCSGLCLFPLGYAFARSWFDLLVINVILGPFISAVFVAWPAFILDSAPKGRKATYSGASNFTFGIGSFIGSLSGGYFVNLLSSLVKFDRALSLGLVFSTVIRLFSGLRFLILSETGPRRK